MHGYGEFSWNDHSKYIGMYENDKKEGFGIFYWPNLNKIYAGYWKDGKQFGPSSLISKNGSKFYFWENENKKKKFKAIWMLEKTENIPMNHIRIMKMNYYEILEYIERKV
jgi:hypothetical protein